MAGSGRNSAWPLHNTSAAQPLALVSGLPAHGAQAGALKERAEVGDSSQALLVIHLETPSPCKWSASPTHRASPGCCCLVWYAAPLRDAASSHCDLEEQNFAPRADHPHLSNPSACGSVLSMVVVWASPAGRILCGAHPGAQPQGQQGQVCEIYHLLRLRLVLRGSRRRARVGLRSMRCRRGGAHPSRHRDHREQSPQATHVQPALALADRGPRVPQPIGLTFRIDSH